MLKISYVARSFPRASIEETVVQAGMDSLGAVEMSNAIVSAFGVSLPATAVFDYPTLGHLAAFSLQSQQRSATQSGAEQHQAPSSTGRPLVSGQLVAQIRALAETVTGAPVGEHQPFMEVSNSLVSVIAFTTLLAWVLPKL